MSSLFVPSMFGLGKNDLNKCFIFFQEREAAARMFSGKKGEKLVNGAMKSKTNK